MWHGQTVSIVLMTYAERMSIREVIDGFLGTGLVDEVIVVDNNAEDGAVAEVEQTDARLVFEPQQGYGHAIRRGVMESTGDLIVLAEPDGTFLPSDLSKLLAYSLDCDAVFGTRTTRELIWRGANMGWFLKWGNWGVAKLVELLFNTSHLSDVGCTYRLFRRPLADSLAAKMRVGGNHAGAEILLLTILSSARWVEIPVNYLPRVGRSSATGSPFAASAIGLKMILLILRFRLRSPRRVPRPEGAGGPGRSGIRNRPPVRGRRVRHRRLGGDHAPHRGARSRPLHPPGDGPGGQVGRQRRRLGPQPGEPILAPAHAPCTPGSR